MSWRGIQHNGPYDRCSKIENQQKDSRSLITKMYRPVVSEIGSPLIMKKKEKLKD